MILPFLRFFQYWKFSGLSYLNGYIPLYYKSLMSSLSEFFYKVCVFFYAV